MTSDKEFQIGGTKFAAVRVTRPRLHWLVRLVETGEVFGPGTGGISNESVPKMQADIQELLDRVSKGGVADFRRRLGLPEATPTAGRDQLKATGNTVDDTEALAQWRLFVNRRLPLVIYPAPANWAEAGRIVVGPKEEPAWLIGRFADYQSARGFCARNGLQFSEHGSYAEAAR